MIESELEFPHLKPISPDIIIETAQAISGNLSEKAELIGSQSTSLSSVPFQKSKVIVFDFDGTISDTEVLHHASFNILLKPYKLSISPNQFLRYRGNTESDVYALIAKDYGLTLPLESTREHRLKIFWELVQQTNLQPFYFVKEILDKSNVDECLCVVLSAQKSKIISLVLGKWKLLNSFSSIITEDLFLDTKANLLKSLPNRFHCEARSIILFEDSKHHILLAKELGMHTYLVKTIK